MGKFIDLTGQRFGRLVVLERAKSIQEGSGEKTVTMWLCKCDCGKTISMRAASIKSGHAKSCGCMNIENRTKNLTPMEYKHGDTRRPLYAVWNTMKARCNNSNDKHYKDYGGRGISVCKEWNSYIPFRDWALSSGYSKGLTIDREDNNGNYESSNCRWVTMKIQGNNTRHNHNVTYNGETKTLKQWAEVLGIKYSTLHARINNYGWSIDEAFKTPIGFLSCKHLTYNGKTQTIYQWANELGISSQILYCRLDKHKWSIEKALTTPIRRRKTA